MSSYTSNLQKRDLDVNTCSKLYARMESIKSEHTKSTQETDHLKAVEEENRHLSDKVEVAQQKIDAIKAAYEQKIQDIEQEKSKLTSLLAEAQEKINELETAPTTFKSDDEAYLAQFDDTDISVLPSIDSDEILSLCEVISDYNDQKWLIRYADLSHDGYYHIFFEA